MSEPKVIYLGPTCQDQSSSAGREWCQDDIWDACQCGHGSVRYVLATELDRITAERDALQQRLNAADQRIDDFAGGECEWCREEDSGIWNSSCGETWSFHEDGPEENGMHFCHSCGKHLVVEVVEQEQDDNWHMNPCKQGHRDVGASGGVAECNQCGEKVEAATTQEAFEQWNASHQPAIEKPDSPFSEQFIEDHLGKMPDQLRDHTKMIAARNPDPDFSLIGIVHTPPAEYDEP